MITLAELQPGDFFQVYFKNNQTGTTPVLCLWIFKSTSIRQLNGETVDIEQVCRVGVWLSQLELFDELWYSPGENVKLINERQ